MLTLERFARLVKQMRAAQSKYFRTKDAAALRESRNYEAHVDAAVKEIEASQQKTLFQGENDAVPNL